MDKLKGLPNEKDVYKRQSQSQQDKQQEWEDVARQVAADMQNFHQQGTGSGDIAQEIDFLTQDKMDYEEFLRTFSVTEEVMKVNQDAVSYTHLWYIYSTKSFKVSVKRL